jgi:hypothetical protein
MYKTLCVVLVSGLSVLMLYGCGLETQESKVTQYEEVTNVRKVSGGYIHYEIENGTVTCRERIKRNNQLTCWKK